MNIFSESSFSVSLGESSSAQFLISVHMFLYFSYNGPIAITWHISHMPSCPVIYYDQFPLEYFHFLMDW